MTHPALRERVLALVRDVPDFPEPGVVFKDVTPLLGDAEVFGEVVAAMAEAGRDDKGRVVVDTVLGMEARGFLFGPSIAQALGVGFVPVRKAGKLPLPTYAVDYQLEYGEATLEIHRDALSADDAVLVVDDVLATGGTAAATCRLVEQAGGRVHALSLLIELTFLHGREQLAGREATAVLTL